MPAVSKIQNQAGEDFITFLVQNNLRASSKPQSAPVRRKVEPVSPIVDKKAENRRSIFQRTHYLSKVAETYLLESGEQKTSAMELEMAEWARSASQTLDKHSHRAKRNKISRRVEEILNKPLLKREHYDQHEFDIFSKTSATVICTWLLALFIVINYPSTARRMSIAFDSIYENSIGGITRVLLAIDKPSLSEETEAEGRVAGAKDSRSVTESYSDFIQKIFQDNP